MRTAQNYKLITVFVLLVGTTLLAGSFSFISKIRAQESDQVTLTAIPPREGDDGSLLLQPGEKKQIQIRVRNSSNQPLPVNSLATDFILDADGETPIPVTEETSNRWSLASWLTLAPQTQVLQPQETGVINVLIEVPEDALPGGHYAMITHEPNPTQLDGGQNGQNVESAAGISQRVGTLVYLIVDGPINEEAFIRDFTIPELTEYGPVPFSFVVENASDIHITPKTKVEFFNFLGNKVDEVVVGEKNVFPLMNRQFDGQWEQIWGYGRYTALATMSYGTSGKIVMARTSFWLLPVKLVLAGLVALLVLIALLIIIRRQVKSRRENSQAKVEMLEQRLSELENKKLQEYED